MENIKLDERLAHALVRLNQIPEFQALRKELERLCDDDIEASLSNHVEVSRLWAAGSAKRLRMLFGSLDREAPEFIKSSHRSQARTQAHRANRF